MQMRWRKMDTAPKDGTEILATDGDTVQIVNWWTDHWGSYSSNSSIPNTALIAWMPLPPITRTVKMRAKHG